MYRTSSNKLFMSSCLHGRRSEKTVTARMMRVMDSLSAKPETALAQVAEKHLKTR